MKNQKLWILLLIAITAIAAVTAAFVWQRRDAHQHAAADAIYYCPMHPTVTSDRPGSCPICGMKLVKKSASRKADLAAQRLAAGGSIEPAHAPVVLSPNERALANVRVEAARMMPIDRSIVTSGRVTYDERSLSMITAYASGRIERLFTDVPGDAVVRGQAVATIYSPDLFSTQQEYLLALRNRTAMQKSGFADARSAADDLVASTRRRLELLGMSRGQIDQLASSGQPFFTTTVISPVSGVVLRKDVVEQQYVTQGQPLFQVADLSSIWVEANVYEQDLEAIAPGQRVSIESTALPGVAVPGVVAAILPALTGETRTATVRIELANRGLKLRPDMFVNVSIDARTAVVRLTVPATAVIDRGAQQLVWVEVKPGTFQPRAVSTGARSGDRVEIVGGLRQGERVVVNGGFLIDADSQINATTGHPM